MDKRVTSIDVAKLAGVSQATVSRVFSPSTNVSEEKQERVLAAARQLGYHPNAIARSLTTNRTNIIGIVMANLTSPFYPYVLEKFLRNLQDMDKQVLVFTAAGNQIVDDIMPLVLQHRVDALIVTSATLSSEMADECAGYGIPVVLFNRYVLDAEVSAVCSDNTEGGRSVANLLLDTGHQRLAYVSGQVNASTNSDREKGFLDRLRERGVVDVLCEEGDFSYESGYQAASRLLALENRPDAIFCACDNMALATIDVARHEFGLHIPDDLSVVGFDDIPMAGWPSYSLTTVEQQVDRMIDETLSLMSDKIENINTPAELRLVPGKLKLRGSVRGL